MKMVVDDHEKPLEMRLDSVYPKSIVDSVELLCDIHTHSCLQKQL